MVPNYMLTRHESVKSFFDKTHLYLHKNFNVSIRALIVRTLLGELNHARILDLGCGDGRISLQYVSPTNHITLVDLSDNMLDIARENTPKTLKTHVSYINMDLQQYETRGQFDVVLCIGVLAHVVSVAETVTKVASFLKPGGRCIFQITDADQCLGKFLVTFYRVWDFIVPTRGYTVNATRLSYMAHVTHCHRLRLLDKQQYCSILPGMGKIPNTWLEKYQMFMLTHNVLSRMGSEVLLLYVKEP